MKALEFVRSQLSPEPSYGESFADQPKIAVTLRLPAELVARLDVLKSKGLGKSRNEVAAVMLDTAFDHIAGLGVLGSDIQDLVAAAYATLTEDGLDDDTYEIRDQEGKRCPPDIEAMIIEDIQAEETGPAPLAFQIKTNGELK